MIGKDYQTHYLKINTDEPELWYWDYLDRNRFRDDGVFRAEILKSNTLSFTSYNRPRLMNWIIFMIEGCLRAVFTDCF